MTSVAKMDEVSLIVLTVLHKMFGEFPSKALTRRKSRYLFFETGSHQLRFSLLTIHELSLAVILFSGPSTAIEFAIL